MVSWRYTRGSRSLAVTLGAAAAAAGDTETITTPPDDDDQDIPQEVSDNRQLSVVTVAYDCYNPFCAYLSAFSFILLLTMYCFICFLFQHRYNV